jgi:hypothetical protein
MYKEINMFQSIKKFFGFGDSVAPEVQNQSAPYKVPEPAATTPIPLVVEQVVPVADANIVITIPNAVVPESIVPKVTKTKAPAKPKAPAKAVKKPVAKKAPRAPKAPSA